MEENKLNARQRRNLKFIEALRTTGSQSNLELKEFRKRQKKRENSNLHVSIVVKIGRKNG